MPAIAERRPDGLYRVRCGTCWKVFAENAKSPAWLMPLAMRHEKEECPATVTPGFWLFDNPLTRKFTDDRMEFITPLLRTLRKQLGIDSALDVGCGLGDFSGFLSQFGIPRVLGIDGRAENVAEAQRRHAGARFEVADVEELPDLGSFDLVLCFGLLYHLENPFRVIRKLQEATRKVLLLDSMCIHAKQPRFELMDESDADNQGLNHVAMYPSEPALVKMLRRSGFAFVYGFRTLPDNEFYVRSKWRLRTRTMMLASRVPVEHDNLILLEDRQHLVSHEADAWKTGWSKLRDKAVQWLKEIAMRKRIAVALLAVSLFAYVSWKFYPRTMPVYRARLMFFDNSLDEHGWKRQGNQEACDLDGRVIYLAIWQPRKGGEARFIPYCHFDRAVFR